MLRKQLTYPATVEPNLDQVLGYDLDRHTPFKSDELYYDAAIVGRDASRSEIRVELVAALRALVDQLRRQAGAWGAEVVAIVPALPHAGTAGAAARLNLLPEIDRREPAWRRWQLWVPVALAVTLAGAAIAVPLLQKRELAIALLHQTEQARVQAAAADALRQQLEQSVDDYNFVLGRKYAYPSTVQLLDDVTRLLPDDTWLTQLELKSPPRGKDPRREILLRGESANAGRLVSLLEDSQLFEQAAPRSPTTKIQPGPGEIFDLGAQLKPLPMPAPVPIGLAANTPDPSVPPGNAARPASSPSQPATPAVTAPATAPAPAGTTSANAAAPSAPATATAPVPAPSTSTPAAGSTTPAATASAPRTASRPVPPAVASTPAGGTQSTPPPRSQAQAQPMPAPAPPARPTFGPLAPDGTTPGATN